MLTRTIPSTGEKLPVVGCGTYRGFDVAPGSSRYRRLPEVLQVLQEAGGLVVDTSPMYGKAEGTLGELLDGPAFVATKVWTRGRAEGVAQMSRSRELLRQRTDLIQVHNLVDWETHLPTLRQWKAEKKVRYLGITHYAPSAYDEVERVLRSETLDFLQINYSLEQRHAEERLLPLAAERGVAVLVNLPFGGGQLLTRRSEQPLPAFAAELGCHNWSELMLKWVLGHPAVTCVIPGTGDPEHMLSNCRAGLGPMLDEHQRTRVWNAWRDL